MKKITPDTLLRIGLGAVFLYAGVNSLINPTGWIGFVPNFVALIVPKTAFLFAHGVFEIILSIVLISGFKTKIAALVSFLNLSALMILYGIDDVTFRDFGLASSALALFLMQKVD